jgi:hypothetical protein
MWCVYDSDGNRLEGPDSRPLTDSLRAVLQANYPQGLIYEAESIDPVGEPVIENGQVTSVVSPNEVWLHITAAGGDGEDPPGAPTEGSAPLSISAALRATQDPASPILAGVNRSYRITVRDAATGAVYDVRKITLASGEMAAVNYSGTGAPGVCEVLESDFDQVEAGGTLYTVRLAQPVRFKFFKTLA